MNIQIYIISFFLSIMGNNTIQDKINLKVFAEEAMSKSLIGSDPIIVANPISVKIYSKLDLKHPFWKKLKREELIVIPKNSDYLEKLWGQQAKENGVIIFKAAEDTKYDIKKLKLVLNGKEINYNEADLIDMKNVNSIIIVKNRNNEERVAFINTIK
jgi:hypothetical protein